MQRTQALCLARAPRVRAHQGSATVNVTNSPEARPDGKEISLFNWLKKYSVTRDEKVVSSRGTEDRSLMDPFSLRAWV